MEVCKTCPAPIDRGYEQQGLDSDFHTLAPLEKSEVKGEEICAKSSKEKVFFDRDQVLERVQVIGLLRRTVQGHDDFPKGNARWAQDKYSQHAP